MAQLQEMKFPIAVGELGFSNFKGKSSFHWPEAELRHEREVGIYFLDFEALPWTAAIVVAPRNHVFVSLPENSVDVNSVFEGLGLQQSSWTVPFLTSIEIRRLFLKELKKNGLASKDFPQGLLPYNGEVPHSSAVGYNDKIRPLNRLWFRSYLIPRTEKARVKLALALRVFWEERGEFFLRGFQDERLAAEDWAERFMGDDSHPEEVLFHNMRCLGEGQHKNRLQIALLESFIASFPDNHFVFADTSPNFDDRALKFGYLTMPVRFKQEYMAMSLDERHVDMVGALRSRIVRMLQWPVFIESASKDRLRAIERFSIGAQVPPGILPYDLVEELDGFLRAMKEKYPSYWSNIWDDIWAK